MTGKKTLNTKTMMPKVNTSEASGSACLHIANKNFKEFFSFVQELQGFQLEGFKLWRVTEEKSLSSAFRKFTFMQTKELWVTCPKLTLVSTDLNFLSMPLTSS